MNIYNIGPQQILESGCVYYRLAQYIMISRVGIKVCNGLIEYK